MQYGQIYCTINSYPNHKKAFQVIPVSLFCYCAIWMTEMMQSHQLDTVIPPVGKKKSSVMDIKFPLEGHRIFRGGQPSRKPNIPKLNLNFQRGGSNQTTFSGAGMDISWKSTTSICFNSI